MIGELQNMFKISCCACKTNCTGAYPMTLLLQNYHFSQHTQSPNDITNLTLYLTILGLGCPSGGGQQRNGQWPFLTKYSLPNLPKSLINIIRHRTLKQWRFAALCKISSIKLDCIGLIITNSVVIVGGIQLGRGGCSWSRPRSPTWFMRPPIHTNNLNCPPRQYSRQYSLDKSTESSM